MVEKISIYGPRILKRLGDFVEPSQTNKKRKNQKVKKNNYGFSMEDVFDI